MLKAKTDTRLTKGIFRHVAASMLCVSLMMPGPFTQTAKASVIGDITGFFMDPLKLGKGSENILETVNRLGPIVDQLSKIEGQTNTDLTNRLNQVQEIINTVIAAVDQNVANLTDVIHDAEQKIAALEQQIYADASDLLWQATCVVEQAGSDQIQRAIAASISNIIKANPGINLLGIRILSLDANDIQIQDPDQAYISLRDTYLRSLASIQDTDSAYRILSAYGNIIRMAKFASCSYQHQPLYTFFLQQEGYYASLMEPWVPVQPKLQ